MKIRTKYADEKAVSPVVGVMLMLVVTIIIAAVVSAFAGGLATQKEKAPQVSLETHIQLTGGMTGGPALVIKHLGGDPVNTRDTKIVTSWVNETGIYHVQSTVAAEYNETPQEYYEPSGLYANYTLSSLNVDYDYGYGDSYYNEPYLVVAGDMPAGDGKEESSLWFGNYIMRPGDLIKADSNLNYDDPYGGDNKFIDKAIIKDPHLLTGNELVNIKLIDLKSGTTFYDKNVVVEV